MTWSKGSGDGYKARKLDRALVNLPWLSSFTEAFAEFLEPGPSEHSPVLVNTGFPLYPRKIPFQFFNFWTGFSGFEEVVFQIWSSPIQGSPQYALCQKLKQLKYLLKTLNKTHFSNIHRRARTARDSLHHIQRQIRSQPKDEEL